MELCGAPVRYGPVSPILDGVQLRSDRILGIDDPAQIRLEVPGVGRFLVENGDQVTVEQSIGDDPGALPGVLHGTIAALLLAQRGQFALHASTVWIGPPSPSGSVAGLGPEVRTASAGNSEAGVGIALAGPSGVGKSTTALALRGRGAELVTDDVSPLRILGESPIATAQPYVVPFGRPLHVKPDAAKVLELAGAGTSGMPRGVDKLSMPAPDASEARLGAVVVLRVDPEAKEVTAARVPGSLALTELRTNTYRIQLLRRVWEAELFAWSVRLDRLVQVWTVVRPMTGWSVDAVADQVEAIAVEAIADSLAAETGHRPVSGH